MKLKILVYSLIISLSFYGCAQDKNPKNTQHTHEIVVADISIPWGFVFLPDNSMLITEKLLPLTLKETPM